MDFTPVIAPVWDTLGWFIVLTLLIAMLNSLWTKGRIDERLARLFAHWLSSIYGVIPIVKLWFEKVFVQAKCWQATVGGSELQAICNTVAEQKAKRDVIITSDHATPNAGICTPLAEVLIVDDKRLLYRAIGSDSRTISDTQNSKILHHPLQGQANILKKKNKRKTNKHSHRLQHQLMSRCKNGRNKRSQRNHRIKKPAFIYKKYRFLYGCRHILCTWATRHIAIDNKNREPIKTRIAKTT